MATLALLIRLVLYVPVLLLWGWAASVLWGWFVVPQFGASELSIPVAIGLMATVRLFRGLAAEQVLGEILAKKDVEGQLAVAISVAILEILIPLLMLAVGFVARGFA